MKTCTLQDLMENAGVIRNVKMCERTMNMNAVQRKYVPASVARGLYEALKEAVLWDSHDAEGEPAVWLKQANEALTAADGEETPDERSMRLKGVAHRYGSEVARQEWEKHLSETDKEG